MTNTVAQAGRRGNDVRSDSWVSISPTESGGIQLSLKSRVDTLYGVSIRELVQGALVRCGIPNADVEMEDMGAYPFVLLARLEAAARRLGIEVKGPLLPKPSSVGKKEGPRDRLRRSRLYLPGNEPKFFINAALHQPDGLILDLEDSVHPDEKDSARLLVRNALVALDFGSCERMVRINPMPMGGKDLECIVPYGVQLILIPKCDSARQVEEIDVRVQEIAAASGGGVVHLMPILESALAIENAYSIASARRNVVAVTIGLEDYTADLGASRTKEGRESFFARSAVVNAARAASVQAIDSVFSDVGDMEGLRAGVLEAKGLGFEGKGCIHPRQIRVVHEAFAPTRDELDRAKRIVNAFDAAKARGVGVVSLGSKMIDPPVVLRATTMVSRAIADGTLAVGWASQEEEN